MKLTNNELSTTFLTALTDLSTIRTNTKVSYNVVKTMKAVQEALDNIADARKQIIETRFIKNEDGKPKVDENGNYIFESTEIENETKELLKELAETEIELTIYPVKLADFGNAEISAKTIYNLKEFIIE